MCVVRRPLIGLEHKIDQDHRTVRDPLACFLHFVRRRRADDPGKDGERNCRPDMIRFDGLQSSVSLECDALLFAEIYLFN